MNFPKVCLATAGVIAGAVWYVRTHYYFRFDVEDEEEWWVIPDGPARDPKAIYGADEALRRWE